MLLDDKSLLTSKTFWFNVATIGLAAVQAAASQDLISNEALVMINALGNVILRLASDRKATLRLPRRSS